MWAVGHSGSRHNVSDIEKAKKWSWKSRRPWPRGALPGRAEGQRQSPGHTLSSSRSKARRASRADGTRRQGTGKPKGCSVQVKRSP